MGTDKNEGCREAVGFLERILVHGGFHGNIGEVF